MANTYRWLGVSDLSSSIEQCDQFVDHRNGLSTTERRCAIKNGQGTYADDAPPYSYINHDRLKKLISKQTGTDLT